MKIIAATLLLFGISSMVVANLSSPKGWRGIVPLHSSRADVERLIGFDAYDRECVGFLCSYYLKDVNVHIKYSVGDCNSRPEGWNVPPDTVIQVDVIPKPSPPVSDFKLDEAKFLRKSTGHLEGVIYYVNEEDGLSVVVANGYIDSFIYEPSTKDRSLRCK